MSRILVVEDNVDLARGIRHNLELEGYQVDWAETGQEGLDLARRSPPDLLILDLMLPDVDGFDVLEILRSESFRAPVLILTARDQEADKVRGFRLDADQYVTKPFGLLELLERTRSLLRRSAGTDRTHSDAADQVEEFGDVQVNLAAHAVERGGRPVHLSPRAFQLLVAMIRNEGRVLSRHDLLRDVWGHRGAVLTRTVDTHVSELRQKLEENPLEPRHILTVWKVGYRFER
jgi:two-component system, OmpR family, alkaline phosphatase synthesis response regulator PhoP